MTDADRDDIPPKMPPGGYGEDLLARLIEAYERRVETAPPPRPRMAPNSPFRPAYQRPERGTRPAHLDPTGETAVGNISRKKKP